MISTNQNNSINNDSPNIANSSTDSDRVENSVNSAEVKNEHSYHQEDTARNSFRTSGSASPDPAFPLANLPANTQKIKHMAEDHEDRRKMRTVLFRWVVWTSLFFLFLGAMMSVAVTCNFLVTSKQVKGVMVNVLNQSSPDEISKGVLQVQPLPPESFSHARENAKEISMLSATQRNLLIEKFLGSTNWLSLTPMITLIAFILGVGLTLSIALMRALFKEEESEEKNNALSQMCTPLSKLIEYLGEYLKSKFNLR